LIRVDAILRFCVLAAGWAGRDRLLAEGADRAGLLLTRGGGHAARWRGRTGLLARRRAAGLATGMAARGGDAGLAARRGAVGLVAPDQPRPRALHEAGGGASPMVRKDGSGVGQSRIWRTRGQRSRARHLAGGGSALPHLLRESQDRADARSFFPIRDIGLTRSAPCGPSETQKGNFVFSRIHQWTN
jgi:hypothetical protein